MNRRAFITGLGAVLAAPLAAEAQQLGKIPRGGILAPGNLPLVHAEAFREGLRDLGYVEGQNIILEWRWEGGDPDRYARLAKDLVRASVVSLLSVPHRHLSRPSRPLKQFRS